MKHLLGAAAVVWAALTAHADARMVRWEAEPNEEHWLPPRQTTMVQPLLGMSPMPTSPPLLPPQKLLDKRSATNNTCAYVSGSADFPLYCATKSACVLHSQRRAFGCCPDRPTATNQFCEAWTTCLHSSEGTRFDPEKTDGLTMWCGNSVYPSCVKHTFADPTLLGFSLWGCGKISTTDLVLNSATDAISTTDSNGRTRTTRSGSTTPTNIIQGGGGNSPQGTGPTSPSGSGASQEDQQGPPLGAIIGGAVGGFAALAILGFAIFFLVRRSRKTGKGHPLHQDQNGAPGDGSVPPGGPVPFGGAAVPPAPGSPGHNQQGHPPTMAELQQQQYGLAPVMNNDPRHSIAKPPYNVTNSVYDPHGMSPPHSPSPVYSNGIDSVPSPPPPGSSPMGQAQQGFGGAWAMPQQQQQQQQQGPPSYQQQQSPPPQQYHAMPPPAGSYPPQQYQQPHQRYSELPTGRGDGELRELA